MLKNFFIAGSGVMLLLVLVWYLWSPAVCLTPITYSLNRLDSEFLITETEVEQAFTEAEKFWENEIGHNLFTYKRDGGGKIKIDFIFDDRQSSANSAVAQKSLLDNQKYDIDYLRQTIAKLSAEHKKLYKTYNQDLAVYNKELSAYNSEVKNYNEIGGAPERVFLRLENKRKELNVKANELSSTVEQLNSLSESINQSGQKLNRIVKEYNLAVKKYNNKFGDNKEFTQGDYLGDRINIYKFSSPYELSVVLAHEFGHALGLEHVEDDDESIMDYLFSEDEKITKISASDKEMLLRVCNDKYNLKLILNKIFNKLGTFR